VPSVNAILANLAQNNRVQELKSRLQGLAKNNGLNDEAVASLFRIEAGINFIASLITSAAPADRQLGTQMVNSYFVNNPAEIVGFGAKLADSNPTVAEASRQVLRAGVESLGTDLMRNPADANLRKIAGQVVASIPNQLTALMDGEDDGKPARQLFVQIGQKEQAAAGALPTGSTAVNFETVDTGGQTLEDLVMVKPRTTAQTNNQVQYQQAAFDNSSYAEAVTTQISQQSSASQVQSFVTNHLSDLTPADLQVLVDKARGQSFRAADALTEVAKAYNDGAKYPDAMQLQADTADLVRALRDDLAALGHSIRLTANEIEASQANVEAIAQIAKAQIAEMDETLYMQNMRAFAQTYPEKVEAEHIQFAVDRLEQDEKTYGAIAQDILSNPDIKAEAFAGGMNALLDKDPSKVLDNHVDRSVEGLAADPATHSETVQKLAATYTKAEGAYGAAGQLGLEATASLTRHADEIAGMLPETTLAPIPTADGKLNAAVASQATRDQMLGLPSGIVTSGIDFLLNNEADEITGEQADMVMAMAEAGKPEFQEVAQHMAAVYNESVADPANAKLSADAMSALGAHERQLKDLGAAIGENVQTNTDDLDFSGLEDLEKSVREIPRALKTPPGTTPSADNAPVVKIDASQLMQQGEEKKELKREGLSNDKLDDLVSGATGGDALQGLMRNNVKLGSDDEANEISSLKKDGTPDEDRAERLGDILQGGDKKDEARPAETGVTVIGGDAGGDGQPQDGAPSALPAGSPGGVPTDNSDLSDYASNVQAAESLVGMIRPDIKDLPDKLKEMEEEEKKKHMDDSSSY
jgi:hypothetical protein